MTVEVVKVEETQMAEVVVAQEETKKVTNESEEVVVEGDDDKVKDIVDESKPKTVEKSSSYKEESNFLSDLKEFERKALNELKAKLEEAILANNIYNKEQKEEEAKECEEEKKDEEIVDTDTTISISLWGVPLLPSKGTEGTDVVLLKFLRAREFKVNDAFEMLKKTLQWRKEAKIDSILEEEISPDLNSAAYMNGIDREGHPVCYNIFGVFESEELYNKAFGNEEKRGQFLRWRYQLMEKGIQKLDLRPGGASSLIQINDLKNSPGPAKKELRLATKHAIGILQDNYPELVAKNIFINVPFWYYALNALISPFLTQRTKSKFVVARPAKVTETLLKYIPVEEIPVHYGGFKRDNDFEFFGKEGGLVSELIIRAGSSTTIEIPALEDGTTLVWDLTVLGWEVNYKEEFVPTDEGSYTIIVQKGKKIGAQEGPIRNTFRTNEPGKLVLTIENMSSRKKRVMYRYNNANKSC